VHTAVYYTARVHGPVHCIARTRPLDGRVRAVNTAVYTGMCTWPCRVYTDVPWTREHDRIYGLYTTVYKPCTQLQPCKVVNTSCKDVYRRPCTRALRPCTSRVQRRAARGRVYGTSLYTTVHTAITWYHSKGNWLRYNFAAEIFYIMKLFSRLFVLYCRNCPKDDKFRYFVPILRKLGVV